MIKLGIYKCDPLAILPRRGTTHAACWDVHACLREGTRIQTINSYNETLDRSIQQDQFEVFPGERVLIPTGLIFEIPEGWSLRLHVRSGTSFKKGLTLTNAEGVLDADYVQQTYVSMINLSDISCTIQHGERVAQMELVPVYDFHVDQLMQPPLPVSDRKGGFGSTGE
jgi:dUTP pyrophosphatase